MAQRLQPPSALTLHGNLKENWRRFQQQFQIYLSASEIGKKGEEIQANTFLHIIGPDALEIYNTFTWAEAGDEKKLAKIIEKFTTYCNPKKNVAYERHIFNRRSQNPGEKIDAYVTELRILAKSCEFGDLHDSLIRDRIVCGIASDSVRRRLLRECDLTLDKTMDICRAAETSDNQMKTFVESKSTEQKIDAVQKRGGKKFGATNKTEIKHIQNCKKCGKSHALKKCPAYGQTCHECGKPNHYAKMCRSKKTKSKKIHEVDPESDSDSEFGIETVEDTHDTRRKWTTTLKVENTNVKFKIDTGAQCNIIPKNMCDKLGITKLQQSKARLISYTGHKLKIDGKIRCTVQHKNKYYALQFYVVPGKVDPIIGLASCEEMNILKLIETVSESKTAEEIFRDFSDVFEGIGCMKGKHHIHIDKNVPPVVHAPRKVSFKMRDKLKEELDRMESLNVIEKVNEPSEWVNSLVIVEKPNRVRICLDPRDLNKAIKREHYPMKTVDDITHQLAGAKVFSTLDASSGFWGIVLDQESSKLTTFNTPFGRYRYKRMPFGISSAPEVFQKRMSQIFEKIEGCDVIMDDILIWGKSVQQHNERLERVLKAVRHEKIKLNKKKCKIQMNEVKYMGHIFGEDGLKTCNDRIKAISEFPEPTNVKELQRFLGMVNYIGKFIQNQATITEPLRELLEKTVAWHWHEKQQQSFDQLKSVLISAPVLKYFNPDEDITLSVDASSTGLGACILQNGQPVAYASRSLNKSERNYAQIEKELLAIVFACKKFHQYIYGQNIHVESDHKPLESLFKKTLSSAPPRIQRMMIKVQPYDLNVKYKPGKYLYIADTLSRATESESSQSDKDEFEVFAVRYLPISDEKVNELAIESAKDKEINALQKIILEGWPDDITECNYFVKKYWNFREELSLYNGIVTKGRRLIIPSKLRSDILNQLHYGHMGAEKCKRRAREVVFWVGINSDIDKKVAECRVCNKYQRRQPKQPLKPHPVPLRPWQKLGLDLFELNRKSFLTVVDYFSKFFEICELQSTTSSSIIKKLKPIFARHGIPEELISDNAPNLVSDEFRKFATEYGFKHTTSSPHYPQSNGMAERTVQTVKNLLKKSNEAQTDPNLALLEIRNTPIDGVGTPTQLLFGRRTRSILPTHEALLKPHIKTRKIRTALVNKQNQQKIYYDRNARELPNLKVGDNVNIQSENKPWKEGVIVQKCPEPRSYVVESEGVEYRRNQRHLMKNSETDKSGEGNNTEIESDNAAVNDNAQNDIEHVQKTRSGRTIKVPEKFSDFVM
ncbi:uncharacterized protein K02A2.6-like [Ostrea edulis]|uniref:uncharacterized protein K02A2.6-like n=1 Tax=Ostrea edulis TaxID=37623 RepID=UPI0024AEDE40|nr:uncharacterized protein K02A2.6-like [Ostrea edulis]